MQSGLKESSRSKIISSPYQQREATHCTATQNEKFSTKNSGKFFLGTSIIEHENAAAENTK
jgi:hypothetical protein